MSGWRGGVVTERATCVVAPNPGPLTLDGTNTWVLAEPGAARSVVVDPGPLDEGHLRRVLDTVRAQNRRVGWVVFTHAHQDHVAGADRFAELVGEPVRTVGETGGVELDGLRLLVVATPGHTSDSRCFVLPADHAVLTGDTVMGRGYTVLDYPDGRLADYLGSLRRLREVAEQSGLTRILPGHGPPLVAPMAVLDDYVAHRDDRLRQVRSALAGGARTPWEVVEVVYAGSDHSLWPAAERTVRATLDYLGVGENPEC